MAAYSPTNPDRYRQSAKGPYSHSIVNKMDELNAFDWR